MLKFLIISFLVMYIVFKLGGFLMRTLLWAVGARVVKNANQYNRTANQQPRRPEGDISIDYVPQNGKPKANPKPAQSLDEEYVDYEEIK